jgi:SAM-dependent methyltransferase
MTDHPFHDIMRLLLPRRIDPMFRRAWWKICREFFTPPDAFDRKYGIETRRTVWRKRVSILGDNVNYEPVDLELFAHGIASVPRVTFVDLGCGKGRALILAHEAGFRDLIGVEMSPKLAAAARSNLQRLGIAANIADGDAAQYPLPDVPLVVHMYNPFGASTMKGVVEKLRKHGFPLYVVYVNPVHSSLLSGFEVIHEEQGLTVFKGQNCTRRGAEVEFS